jgi:dihydrofolate reductase
MHGPAKEFFDSLTEGMGCGIVGRNMYEAAGAWCGSNPFPGTLIVLTHRTEASPTRAPASCSSTASMPLWPRPASSTARTQ